MKLSRVTESRLWHAGAAIFYIWLALSFISQLWEAFGPSPKTPRTTTSFFGMCQYTVLQEVESPDKDKVASLGVSDCGGTSGWQTGVSVHNRVMKETYHLLLLQGRPDGYRINWENEYTVVASGFSIGDVLELRRDNFSGAKIVLRPTDLRSSKP